MAGLQRLVDAFHLPIAPDVGEVNSGTVRCDGDPRPTTTYGMSASEVPFLFPMMWVAGWGCYPG